MHAGAGLSLSALKLDQLRFFLGGAPEVAHQLHELIGASTLGVLVRGEQRKRRFAHLLWVKRLFDNRKIRHSLHLIPIAVKDITRNEYEMLRHDSVVRLYEPVAQWPGRTAAPGCRWAPNGMSIPRRPRPTGPRA